LINKARLRREDGKFTVAPSEEATPDTRPWITGAQLNEPSTGAWTGVWVDWITSINLSSLDDIVLTASSVWA